MDLEESLEYFKRNYHEISSYTLDGSNKIHIGERGGNCRFCGKVERQIDFESLSITTFKNVAHAVPEFLGNKQLILLNECDSCNKYFSSALENHLDNFTKPFRTISKIKGKRQAPDYKSKDGLTKFVYRQKFPPAIISPNKSQNVIFDEKNKEIIFKFDVGSHIPVAVYKCLVKIALSVINKEKLHNFIHALIWIRSTDHSRRLLRPLTLLRTFVPGDRPIRNLIVKVFQKKDLITARPNFIFVIGFGNIYYQIVIPSELDVLLNGKGNEIVFFPLSLELNVSSSIMHTKTINLDDFSIVKDREERIVYSFEERVALPEYKGKTFAELGIKYETKIEKKGIPEKP